jgi:hypothetical protein
MGGGVLEVGTHPKHKGTLSTPSSIPNGQLNSKDMSIEAHQQKAHSAPTCRANNSLATNIGDTTSSHPDLLTLILGNRHAQQQQVPLASKFASRQHQSMTSWQYSGF